MLSDNLNKKTKTTTSKCGKEGIWRGNSQSIWKPSLSSLWIPSPSLPPSCVKGNEIAYYLLLWIKPPGCLFDGITWEYGTSLTIGPTDRFNTWQIKSRMRCLYPNECHLREHQICAVRKTQPEQMPLVITLATRFQEGSVTLLLLT